MKCSHIEILSAEVGQTQVHPRFRMLRIHRYDCGEFPGRRLELLLRGEQKSVLVESRRIVRLQLEESLVVTGRFLETGSRVKRLSEIQLSRHVLRIEIERGPVDSIASSMLPSVTDGLLVPLHQRSTRTPLG